MPASTPTPWLIPYPVGTDRVADGDNAMQAIAERVALISNALPRGLIGTAVAGASTPSGTAQVAALAAFTTTEARDFFATITCRGKSGTAGCGFSFDVKVNNVIVSSFIAVLSTSTFDADASATLLLPGVAAGSQTVTLWVAGYGSTNNTLTSARLTIADAGATGAI